MTYFILANPNSGAKKGSQVLEVLIPYLQQNQLTYRLFRTSKTGQESDLIAQILTEKLPEDSLLIIGGDGTISLAIDALPQNIPFSYIPAGSGNDFARSLGISFDPIEAFKAIQKNIPHTIHIIKYSSKHLSGYALNNIGIGLDAQIVKSANEGKFKTFLNKIKLGNLAYLFTALHVLFTKKAFSASIETEQSDTNLNSQHFDNAFLMTFTKHPYFGGGIKIAPNASNLTDKIDLVEFDRLPLWKIFPVVPEVLHATHLKNPLFFHKVHSNFIITTHENQPVQIDGETHEILKDDALILTTQERTIIF